MAATPQYGDLLGVLWGNYYDGAISGLIAGASGIIVGNNPSYSPTDFFAMYPAFGGKTVSFTAVVDGTTNVLTGVSSTTGLTLGSYISGQGIQSGSYITAFDSNAKTVTLNQNTTTAVASSTVTDYANPLVPTPILLAYIYLATSSLVYERYQEMWMLVMGLFIAHYCTLWLQTQATTPNANAQQVAASGLALGIKTAKSAGDVSVGLQPLVDLEGWGSFQLTAYGQQFATIAKVIGSTPMFLY